MNTTELSIIIPVYYGQDYIGRCLDSVLRQRDADKYEIIVIDGGSSDRTIEIVKKIAKGSEVSIKILRNEKRISNTGSERLAVN